MKEVGALEAESTLNTLLDLVEQGEEIVITRHGKQVARLVPTRDGGHAGPRCFDWDEWKAYVEDGRP